MLANGGAACPRLPPFRANVVWDHKGRVFPAQPLARSLDLLGAERVAMRGGGAGLGRRAVGDDRAAGDKAGPIARMGAPDRGGDRVVIHAVDPLGGPAMRAEPHDLIVRDGEIGRPVDRDRIVVPEDDQLVELEMPGEPQRFVADPFHQAAVAEEDVRVVIDDVMAVAVELGGEQLLGERHADGIGQPLPKRARGGFHPGRDSDLRMPGGFAVQLTKALQFFQRQCITAEVQQRIQQHRSVTIGQYEAVAVGPERIGRIVLQVPAPQHFSDFRHPQRHAGMTAVGGLHGVDGEKAQRIAQFPPLNGLRSDLSTHAARLPTVRVA